MIEYFTLGSENEATGLTLMTRVVGADGKPTVQYGNGPDGWYKAKRITEVEYKKLKEMLLEAKDLGFFGIVNEEGKQKAQEMFTAVHSHRVAEEDKIFAHEAKKIDRMVAAGILDEEDVDQEIENRGLGKVKDKIKDKRNKKPE